MAQPPMTRLRQFLVELSDRINPIVIKELRQAVQGRFVAGLLLCFLLVQVVTLSIFLLFEGISEVDQLTGGNEGREVAGFIFAFLFFVAVVVIPLVTGMRFHLERANEGFALLFITTLRPRSIIAGKLLANQILGILLFSACLPFLSFTYFLRGIDLLSILVVLGFGFVVMSVMIMATIFLAGLPVSRFLKSLFGIGMAIGLLITYTMTVAFSTEMLRQGVGSRLAAAEFWEAAGAFVGLAVVALLLLFVLSVALVSPPASNRALPVRGTMTGTWLLSTAIALLIYAETDDREVIATYGVLWLLFIGGVFLVAVSSRDALSRRLAQELPRRRLARAAAFFFWPGSAPTLAWGVAATAATLVAMPLLARLGTADLNELMAQCASMAAYFLAYALTTFAVHRQFLAARVEARHTGIVVLVLMVLGILLPPIVGLMITPELGDEVWDTWIFLNPFAAFNRAVVEKVLAFSFFWAGAALLVSSRWLVPQLRPFVKKD